MGETLVPASGSPAFDATMWATAGPHLPGALAQAMRRQPGRSTPWIDFEDGSLLLADVSGFTPMSERLSESGKEGAELLTNVINDFFHRLLDTAREHGGVNITFGGDALLLLFTGENHAARAVAAAVAMQRAIRRFSIFRAGGHRFRLNMKVGVHSGLFCSAAAGLAGRRMQYLVLGDEASRVVDTQGAGLTGELMITRETLDRLGGLCVTETRNSLYRVLNLSKRPMHLQSHPEAAAPLPISTELLSYLPPPILQGLQTGTLSGGEHRKVSIMFINLIGVNELLREQGAAVLLTDLQQYLSRLIQAADRYGGFLVGNDLNNNGIKLIVVFGAPVAHEQDSANALRLALEISRELPRCSAHLRHRIGINSGFVFAGDIGAPYCRQYTVMGDAVNLAARLMGAASPGQTLLSRSLFDEVDPVFEVRELDPLRLKGKKEPVRVCSLVGERRAAHHPVQDRAGNLVGRHAELEALKGVCAEVEGGAARAVVISGEAGIGKSRLVSEFLGHLKGRGWIVHSGQAYSHTASTPFMPWTSVLNSLFAIGQTDDSAARGETVLTVIGRLAPDRIEMAPLLNGLLGLSLPESVVVRSLNEDSRRRGLFELVAVLVGGAVARMPMAILMEDLQWADQSSIQLLNHVGANVKSSCSLLCITHRPMAGLNLELPPVSTKNILLGELSREAAQSIICRALDRPELPGHVKDAILSKAQGNPFFLEQVASSISHSGIIDQLLNTSTLRLAEQTVALAIPDRIQTLLMSRIDTLNSRTKDVLRTAAVVGTKFEVPTLRAALDLAGNELALERSLQELAQVDFIYREGDTGAPGYRFKHSLVQEVAYDSLLFSRRRELHRRIGSYLEESNALLLEPLYEVLAHHYGRCAEHGKTLVYAVKSAGKARRVFAHDEAIAYYRRALEAIGRSGGAVTHQRSYVIERIGDCYEAWGQHVEAAKAFFDSLRSWRVARRYESPPPLVPELSEKAPLKARECSLCHKIAVAYERNSSYDLSLKWLESALRTLPPRIPLYAARICTSKSVGLFRKGHYEEAVRWGRLGLSLSRRAGDRHQLAYAHTMLASSYLATGNVRLAAAHRRSAVLIFDELGDVAGQGLANNNLGLCYQTLGDLDKALAHYEVALKARTKLGNTVHCAIVHGNIGEVLFIKGRTEEAMEQFRKVVETYEQKGDPRAAAGLALINLSRGCLLRQDYRGAGEHLQRATELLRKAGSRGLLAEAALQQAELELEAGEVDQATRSCKKATDEARELGMKLLEARGERIQGRIALTQGSLEEAEHHLRASFALADRHAGEYEKGLALLCLADLYRCQSRARQAARQCQGTLRKAISVFQRLGAERDLSRALEIQASLS